MKVNQNVRHFASRKALETPGVRSLVKRGLVKLHTRVFLARADEAHREDRRAHLDSFFEATMDTYLVALQEGYSEAEAREITHIQANFDFYNHGWTEMMEFPVDEVDEHVERFADFFERHDITVAEPLGAFEPADGIPDAPATLEKLEDPEQPHAVGGYADDTYVDTGEEVKRGDRDDIDAEAVDVEDAVGISDDS